MSPALIHNANGELLAAEISTSPRLLEELLEALASAAFPINPEIRHAPSGGTTTVSFPMYESQLPGLQDILATSGFAPSLLTVRELYEADRLALERTL